MRQAVFFDCEMLAKADSMRRFWCGPDDPDPTVFQIGGVTLGLENDFPILGDRVIYVTPRDRQGEVVRLDPFISDFTGVTEAVLDEKGVSLSEALDQFAAFAGEATCWSWGADERNMVALGCFVAGMPVPIPATQFRNATTLMLASGMPIADIQATPSNGLAGYFGIEVPGARAHDARDDAMSIALAVQYLLREGKLSVADLH